MIQIVKLSNDSERSETMIEKWRKENPSYSLLSILYKPLYSSVLPNESKHYKAISGVYEAVFIK